MKLIALLLSIAAATVSVVGPTASVADSLKPGAVARPSVDSGDNTATRSSAGGGGWGCLECDGVSYETKDGTGGGWSGDEAAQPESAPSGGQCVIGDCSDLPVDDAHAAPKSESPIVRSSADVAPSGDYFDSSYWRHQIAAIGQQAVRALTALWNSHLGSIGPIVTTSRKG
jgi:hypothetical protein